MGKLSGIFNAAIVIAMIVVACNAQQTTKSPSPLKSLCGWDAERNFQFGAPETSKPSAETQINLAPQEPKRKPWFCGPSDHPISPGSSVSSLDSVAVLRPSGFNFEFMTAETVSKSGVGSVLAANSSPGQAQAPAATEAQELAKKLSNPVASLISFPMQSNFDFGMGTGSGWRYTLNVQPVIPIKLSQKWNLISRTIIPIIHQGNVTGPNTSESGLGDTVQSLFFSPNKSEPFIWAVGPVVLIPTATNAKLGAQKWGLGPTALVLKQKKGWTYGMLANHIWSVAGKSNRAEVNATFVQPFVSFTNKQAWTYSINTESTYDWNGHSWSIPINPFISKLVRFGKQPVSFGGGLKCWVTTPTGGPEGCGLRVVVTALFPKK